MTDSQTRLKEIKQRLEEAIRYYPPPWSFDDEALYVVDAGDDPIAGTVEMMDGNDAALVYPMIAHAPVDIRFLLEEVEKLTWANRVRIQEYNLLGDDEAVGLINAVVNRHPDTADFMLALRQHINAWKEKWQSRADSAEESSKLAGERLGEIMALSAKVLQLQQQLAAAQKPIQQDTVIPDEFKLDAEGEEYTAALGAILWALSVLRRHSMNHNQRHRRLMTCIWELENLHSHYRRAKPIRAALWWLRRANVEEHPGVSHADIKARIAIAEDLLIEHCTDVEHGQIFMRELREAIPSPRPNYPDGRDGAYKPDSDDIPF